MSTLAHLLNPCSHRKFSPVGNTHGYSARTENVLCEQLSAQASRRFMISPGQVVA